MIDLETKIRSFAALEKGWDSYDADAPNEVAIERALIVLQAMSNHGLRPSQAIPCADGGVAIYVAGGFNQGHMGMIACINDKTVIGTTHNQEDQFKFWWLSDFDGDPGTGELVLTLAESIEYLRHYVWANHSTN